VYSSVPVPQLTKDQELEWLKEQSQMMQEQLHQINTRISELTADQEKV
jgi:prefoldin subunit 5